jgi:hypothetical protein
MPRHGHHVRDQCPMAVRSQGRVAILKDLSLRLTKTERRVGRKHTIVGQDER